MIEPSDVSLGNFGFSPNPTANQFEPTNSPFNGAVKFLDRAVAKTVDVGQVFEQTIRMGGKRPITVKVEQIDPYDSRWKLIGQVELLPGYLGFKLQIRTRDRYAGILKLRYIATNPLTDGAISFEQSLTVRQNHYGG